MSIQGASLFEMFWSHYPARHGRPKLRDPMILGVRMSQWPTDELLWLPWHAVSHLTDEEKRRILARARREGLIPPRKQGA